MQLPTPKEPSETTPAKNKKAPTSDEIFAALQAANGLLSPAATILGVSRSVLAKAMKSVHHALCQELKDAVTDTAEAKLFRMIELGDERAVQFWLTRQGKTRGYSEKQEIKVEGIASPEDSKARREAISRLLKGIEEKESA